MVSTFKPKELTITYRIEPGSEVTQLMNDSRVIRASWKDDDSTNPEAFQCHEDLFTLMLVANRQPMRPHAFAPDVLEHLMQMKLVEVKGEFVALAERGRVHINKVVAVPLPVGKTTWV